MKKEKKKKIESNLEMIKRLATTSLLARGKCPPHLLVVGTEKSAFVGIGEMPDTTEKREKMMFMAGTKIGEDKRLGLLEEVYFISEGWALECKKGETPKYKPSQAPNKKEVLVISGVDFTQDKPQEMLTVFELIRDRKKELKRLKEWKGFGEGKGKNFLLKAFIAGYLVGIGIKGKKGLDSAFELKTEKKESVN